MVEKVNITNEPTIEDLESDTKQIISNFVVFIFLLFYRLS